MNGFGKLLTYLKRGDRDAIVAGIHNRIPSWVRRNGIAYIFESRAESSDTSDREVELPPGCEARLLRRDEMPQAAAITGLPASEFYRRLDAGSACFGIVENDRVININWYHRGICFIRGAGYFHEEGLHSAYTYGTMTDVAERRRGIFKKAKMLLDRHLFSVECTRLVAMVQEDNLPVLRTFAKLGYEQTKTLRYRILMGVRTTHVTDHRTGTVEVMRTRQLPEGIFWI